MIDIAEVIRKYKESIVLSERLTEEAKANIKKSGQGLQISKSSKINTRRTLANFCGVSEDTYRKLDAVMNCGNQILQNKMLSGEITINAAWISTFDRIVVEEKSIIIEHTIFWLYNSKTGKKNKLLDVCSLLLDIPNEIMEKLPDHMKQDFIVEFEDWKNRMIQDIQMNGNFHNTTYDNYYSGSRTNTSEISFLQKSWRSCYRMVCKYTHPDNGGDTADFRMLNEFNALIKNLR